MTFFFTRTIIKFYLAISESMNEGEALQALDINPISPLLENRGLNPFSEELSSDTA